MQTNLDWPVSAEHPLLQRFLVFSQCNQTWNIYCFISLDCLVTVGYFFWAVQTPRSHYHIKLLNDEIKYNYDLLYTFRQVAIHLLKSTSGGTGPDVHFLNVTSWWCRKLLQKSQKWWNNVHWAEEPWLIFCPGKWNKMASNMQQTKLFQTECRLKTLKSWHKYHTKPLNVCMKRQVVSMKKNSKI